MPSPSSDDRVRAPEGTRVDEIHEPKRATDFSSVARLSSWLLRWSPILVFFYSIVYAWFLTSGYFVSTPKAQIDTLRVEITRNRAITRLTLDSLVVRADTAEARSQKVVDILEIFSIDLCIRRQTDPYVYTRLGCSKLLRGGRP